jgi:N-terminal domain of (some) glycogen debranching enzymes
MAFKVQVGPAQIAIHQGQTVLVTEPNGQVRWPSEHGLYFRDTRLISAWAIYATVRLGTCSMAVPSPFMQRASF